MVPVARPGMHLPTENDTSPDVKSSTAAIQISGLCLPGCSEFEQLCVALQRITLTCGRGARVWFGKSLLPREKTVHNNK
jgi:hypothetical protein